MSLTASAHSVPGTLRQDVDIDGRHRLESGIQFVERIELQPASAPIVVGAA